MYKSPIFHQVNGLTACALACGYIQRVEFTRENKSYVRVDLWHEGACYHVRVVDSENDHREWYSYESLGRARKVWLFHVRQTFSVALRSIRKDKRYSVSTEGVGTRHARYVARFCGDFIGYYTTREEAWITGCYQSRADRVGHRLEKGALL